MTGRRQLFTTLIALLFILSAAVTTIVSPAVAQQAATTPAAFVSGFDRVTVYQTEIAGDGSAYGLSPSPDAAWVVAILDLTNFGTAPQTLSLGDFQLSVTEGGTPITATASQAPSAKLGFADVQPDGAVTVPVDSTIRMAVPFAVPSGSLSGQADFQQDPLLGYGGEQTNVRSTIVDALNAGGIAPAQPWTGAQGIIQSVPGNGAIEVNVGGTVQTVQLAGITTPPADGCFGAESSEAVTSLSGGSVWVEDDPTSEGSLVWYWDAGRGHLGLMNQTLTEQGFAAYDPTYDGTQYAAWLSGKSGSAESSKAGLWANCKGAGGEWINPPTPTPVPTKTADEVRAEYTWIDIRDLAIRPQQFEGQKIAFQGEVFNVPSGQTGDAFQFQIWVTTPTGDQEPVFVYFLGDASGIYEGTFVTVYGVGDGYVTGTNSFGGEITQPLVRADIIDR